jgi:hypothetical protein
MRWPELINCHRWISRLGLMIAAASLLVASAAHAVEMKDLTQNMPRGYFGEFSWEGDRTVQNVVITLESVRALNEQNVEALGCGSYEVGRQVTKIRVRMFVRLSDLQVEIFELSPEGSGSFETGGSHRGKLSDDLQQIEAQWTTTARGQRGQMQLRAAPSLTCAPASST